MQYKELGGILRIHSGNINEIKKNLSNTNFTENINNIININKLEEIFIKNVNNIIEMLTEMRGNRQYLLERNEFIENNQLEKFNILKELNIDRSKGINFDMIVKIIKTINQSKIMLNSFLQNNIIQKTGGTNKDYKDITHLLILKYLSIFGNENSNIRISFPEIGYDHGFVKLGLFNEKINNIFIGYGNTSRNEGIYSKYYKSGDIIIDNETGYYSNYLDNCISTRYSYVKERYGENSFRIFKIK